MGLYFLGSISVDLHHSLARSGSHNLQRQLELTEKAPRQLPVHIQYVTGSKTCRPTSASFARFDIIGRSHGVLIGDSRVIRRQVDYLSGSPCRFVWSGIRSGGSRPPR